MNASSPPYSILAAGRQTIGEWQGRVHSKFERAVNIITADRRITLLANPLWISEHNIIFNDKAALALVSPSSTVAVQRGVIYVDGRAVAAYPSSSPWQMPTLAAEPMALGALIPVERLFKQYPSSALVQGLEQRFIAASERFIAGLPTDFSMIIGAGPGLTPSGDDMLVGFALALYCYRPDLLPHLADLCQPYLNATTDISRYLLQDAFNGRFIAPLALLLLALQQNCQIETRLAVAVDIGSSSGRDGIWGMHQGICLLAPYLPWTGQTV
jgi:hypothetical protein